MLVKSYPRGTEFKWTFAPVDVDGSPASPDSVTLYVSYLDAEGVRVVDEIEMESDTDGIYSAQWDSSVAKPCRVSRSIRTINPPSADDEIFDLTANLANPDPEGTA